MAVHPSALGEAGRYRVASELLLRGYRVLVPSVDDGVDLCTECGLGIQVKTSHSCNGKYHFLFRQWAWRSGKKKGTGFKKQKYGRIHAGVTHLILWCINDDVMMVVPLRKDFVPRGGHVTISLKSGKSKWVKFIGAWNLLGR